MGRYEYIQSSPFSAVDPAGLTIQYEPDDGGVIDYEGARYLEHVLDRAIEKANESAKGNCFDLTGQNPARRLARIRDQIGQNVRVKIVWSDSKVIFGLFQPKPGPQVIDLADILSLSDFDSVLTPESVIAHELIEADFAQTAVGGNSFAQYHKTALKSEPPFNGHCKRVGEDASSNWNPNTLTGTLRFLYQNVRGGQLTEVHVTVSNGNVSSVNMKSLPTGQTSQVRRIDY